MDRVKQARLFAQWAAWVFLAEVVVTDCLGRRQDGDRVGRYTLASGRGQESFLCFV